MQNLQLWRLRQFCKHHGLDIQLIDSTLTYGENIKFLKTMVTDFSVDERAAKSFMEQYLAEHALSDYVMATLQGETKLDLQTLVSSTFSLKDWTEKHLNNPRAKVVRCEQ